MLDPPRLTTENAGALWETEPPQGRVMPHSTPGTPGPVLAGSSGFPPGAGTSGAGTVFVFGGRSIPAVGRALVATNCPAPLFETMKVQYLSEECSSSYQLFSGVPTTCSTCCETLSGSLGYIPRSIHEHSPGANPSRAGLVPLVNLKPMLPTPGPEPIAIPGP